LESFTYWAHNCQTVFTNILFKFHEKKNMRTQSELGILFRCCGESLNNRTNKIMVEITQKHFSALDPVSLKTPHIRAFKIVFSTSQFENSV